MNTLQFYYAREVLGVRAILKPKILRTTYQLSRPLACQQDFLFFCGALKTSPQKELIKNIARALKGSAEQVVEMAGLKPLPFLLNNLICRFPPSKGFVIFGEDLADKIRPPSDLGDSDPAFKQSLRGEEVLALPAPFCKSGTIPGCLVPSISQLTSPDPAQAQKAKQKAWGLLHKTFL